MNNNTPVVLDAEQLECAEGSPTTALRIIAGPGSGKTATIIARAAFLLKEGASADKLMMTTFTRKAAEEMKQRLQTLVGVDNTTGLRCNTFHAIASQFRQLHCQVADNTMPTLVDDAFCSSYFKELLENAPLTSPLAHWRKQSDSKRYAAAYLKMVSKKTRKSV